MHSRWDLCRAWRGGIPLLVCWKGLIPHHRDPIGLFHSFLLFGSVSPLLTAFVCNTEESSPSPACFCVALRSPWFPFSGARCCKLDVGVWGGSGCFLTLVMVPKQQGRERVEADGRIQRVLKDGWLRAKSSRGFGFDSPTVWWRISVSYTWSGKGRQTDLKLKMEVEKKSWAKEGLFPLDPIKVWCRPDVFNAVGFGDRCVCVCVCDRSPWC